MSGDVLVYDDGDEDKSARVRLFLRERLDNDGVLLIETVGSGESNRLAIPPGKRNDVALALLGGITDELVERWARRTLERWANAFRPTLRWSDLACYEQEERIEEARDEIKWAFENVREFFD